MSTTDQPLRKLYSEHAALAEICYRVASTGLMPLFRIYYVLLHSKVTFIQVIHTVTTDKYVRFDKGCAIYYVMAIAVNANRYKAYIREEKADTL